MRIGIIGLGMIGGSLAKALHARTAHEVLGTDLNPAAVAEATAAGVIKGGLDLADLSTCETLILAIPPVGCLAFLREHASRIAPGALVVDCCGVKRSICTLGFEKAAENNFHFLGGHPMAGREFSGFGSAQTTLFDRAVMLLIPRTGEDEAIIRRVEELFLSIGFGRVLQTTMEQHDERIAITSQLAHVVSNAYVKSPRAGMHHGFSAGSFADLTRVARLNEKLWTELFLENGDYLIREIDELTGALKEYREAIAGQDATRLCELLKKGRECKEQQDEHR